LARRKRVEAEEHQQYTVGTWRGTSCYRCNLCAYDSLDESDIKEHILARHTPRPKIKPVTVPIYDRFGNLIGDKEE